MSARLLTITLVVLGSGCSGHFFPQWKTFSNISELPSHLPERARPYEVQTITDPTLFADAVSTSAAGTLYLTTNGDTIRRDSRKVVRIQHHSHRRGTVIGTIVGLSVTALAVSFGAVAGATKECDDSAFLELGCNTGTAASMGASFGLLAVPLSIGVGAAIGSTHGWVHEDIGAARKDPDLDEDWEQMKRTLPTHPHRY